MENNNGYNKYEYKGGFYSLRQLEKMSGGRASRETIRTRYINGYRDDLLLLYPQSFFKAKKGELVEFVPVEEALKNLGNIEQRNDAEESWLVSKKYSLMNKQQDKN